MSKQINQEINIIPDYLSVLTAYRINEKYVKALKKNVNRNKHINPQY